MNHTIPLICIAAIMASCDRSSKPAAEESSNLSHSSEAPKSSVDDGQAEADQYVEEIKDRVLAGLPSYYQTGEAKITLEPAMGSGRRGILVMPIIAATDLYQSNGKQAGSNQLIELVKKMGDSESVRLRLIGNKTADRWYWRDAIEEDVMIDRNVRPKSYFKGGMVQDSPEHLAFLRKEEGIKQREADEAAALDAKAREEKLPPLQDLLRPGRKSIGMVGDKYFHLVVASSDSAGTQWTIDANTMSKDGIKHFTDRGKVLIGYDPKTRNVIVQEVTLGALRGIRGASVSIKDGSLSFSGGRAETTRAFQFK